MKDARSTAESTRPYHPPDDPRLPRFSSYAEEATFWEIHDFETLEPLSPDELAERASIEREWRTEQPGSATQLTVQLDRRAYDALVKAAHARGVEPAALAVTWLRERLKSA